MGAGHKLLFARSMGRLAVAFMLFMSIATIVWLNHYLQHYLRQQGFVIKGVFLAGIILLAGLHLAEIKGYLKQPQAVKGNDILNVMDKQDGLFVKGLLQGRKAIMTVPAFRDNIEWTKTCYALAFYAGIPISGASASLGTATPEQFRQYDSDVVDLFSGNVGKIVGMYGDVVIAAPQQIAAQIAARSDLPLKAHPLASRDVSILILDVNR